MVVSQLPLQSPDSLWKLTACAVGAAPAATPAASATMARPRPVRTLLIYPPCSLGGLHDAQTVVGSLSLKASGPLPIQVIAPVRHSAQRSYLAFLFVAATQSLRPGSLLLGDAARQAVSAAHYGHDALAELRALGTSCASGATRYDAGWPPRGLNARERCADGRVCRQDSVDHRGVGGHRAGAGTQA